MRERIVKDANNMMAPILKSEPKQEKPKKNWLIFLILGLVFLVGGVACLVIGLLKPEEIGAVLTFPKIPSSNPEAEIYSDLTGETIASTAEKNLPVYCIQTPNGTDGARPQAGLNQAGVIFEAIAEAGITRFAAIYQEPTSAIIGPIRSLRMYYLDWDTPFNCTIVHAGGADDAIRAVSNGDYRNLDESYTYMYRGTRGERRWNNLFTTSELLKQFNTSNGYLASEVKGFSRMTPVEAKKQMVDNLVNEKLDILNSTSESTSELEPKVSVINLSFGSSPTFNVHYDYDVESNTYLRSYGNGNDHEVYVCPNEDLGKKDPESVCTLKQMAPSVVIAMVVAERKAADNYHEDITTIGSGNAFIFQNGDVVKATWRKDTKQDQIKFLDKEGQEIKLAPGQTFVSAIPNYGSIEY
ncbi:DUF3048 domain-containing protein [Candidatus Saccharibacteria bacterium]|nr:DUF3048 domain-containing protein [Candidatus Saccharibacteria bacterium]